MKKAGILFLGLSLLLLPAVVLDVDASSEEVLLEPHETGAEVLLNGPGISFDLSVLEGLLDEGSARALETPEGSAEWGDTGIPWPDTFLMRSSFDPELGVVLRVENFTEMLLSRGYDNPLGGLSVSIVVPGDIVVTEKVQSFYTLAFNHSGSPGDLVQDISNAGFSNVIEYRDPWSISITFSSGSADLDLTIVNSTGAANNNSSVTIFLRVEPEAFDEALLGKIHLILGMFGQDADLWNSSERVDLSVDELMVDIGEKRDIETIDWESHMMYELEYLVEAGVVSGLTEDDIISISSQCRSGVYGFERRIFFHYGSMEWRPYNITGLPPPLLESFGPSSTFREADFPLLVPRTDNTWPRQSGLLIAVICAGVALLLLGSLLYQRIDRAAKLNNARRKMIYERIRQMPGIHFSALMKDLDLKPGVASYHINRLEKAEMIKSFQDGMYRRFYLYEDKVEMRIMLSDLQKIILHTISEEPGISQIDISKLIGKSKVVINYHVRFLRDLGILVLEKDGRETHCYLTPQGARVQKA